jgi:hypothetical protein
MALTPKEIEKIKENAQIVVSRGEGSYRMHHDDCDDVDSLGAALSWIVKAVGEAYRPTFWQRIKNFFRRAG